MKRKTTIILAVAAVLVTLIAAVGLVRAAGSQAYLGIFAETRMVKMPMPTGLEGSSLSAAQADPARALFMGKPLRFLQVRLWSPGTAPADATATLGIPAGLGLGSGLKLDLYRPSSTPGTATAPGAAGASPDKRFTIKRYWGSSPTVPSGQPEMVSWETLTPEQRAALYARAQRAPGNQSYFYQPDWSTAYWPGGQAQGQVAGDALLPGTYDLSTNYTGNVNLEVPAEVNFLPPIEMISPSATPSLEQPLSFAWKPIANVMGYHMLVTGVDDKNTLIIWTSSDVREDRGINWDYLPMIEVLDLVESGYMMDGEHTSATVPAGIFRNCRTVSLMMVGYGPGAALAQGQPLPRIQTRTMLDMMLSNPPPPQMP